MLAGAPLIHLCMTLDSLTWRYINFTSALVSLLFTNMGVALKWHVIAFTEHALHNKPTRSVALKGVCMASTSHKADIQSDAAPRAREMRCDQAKG